MKIKYIMLAILVLCSTCQVCARDLGEAIEELDVKVEDLEKKSFTRSNDSQALYSKIESLEEATKNLNNKVEELTKQMNQYSSSMQNLKEEINNRLTAEADKTSNIVKKSTATEDVITKYAQDNSSTTPSILSENGFKPVEPAKLGDIKSEFDYAFNLLKNSEYESSEKAFSDFINKYPKDELSGSAYYWLGESYYHRKIYNKAALNYLYGIKYFPSGSKSDLSTYKLSMCFAKLNKKQEACQNFANFLDKFKKAPDSLIKSARDEMTKLSCK